jgi:hypothetical protein
MDGSRDDSPASVIQTQECSRACFRIAREVMRSGDTVQGLNEIRDRLPPGLFGAAGRQRDKEMVRSIRMRAIKLEVRSNVSGLFAETRRGTHHFASDGMDLGGRKALRMLALAAPGEKSREKEQSKWNCRPKPSQAITSERNN